MKESRKVLSMQRCADVFWPTVKTFSEEKLQKAQIGRRFENDDLSLCIKEIEDYIKSEMNCVNSGENRTLN